MSVHIIDALEMVNVKHDGGQWLSVAAGAQYFALCETEERPPVQRLGQRVCHRHVEEVAFVVLGFDQVSHGVAGRTPYTDVLADKSCKAFKQVQLELSEFPGLVVNQAEAAKPFAIRIPQWSAGEEYDRRIAVDGRIDREMRIFANVRQSEYRIGQVCA